MFETRSRFDRVSLRGRRPSRSNRALSQLYYGDNLDVLREHVADESVDLIYLDPPFNSNANYNVLFRSPTGGQSDAQIEAFEDTWHWNDKAEDAFDRVAHSGNTKAFDLLNAMRAFLGENDMMAYLAMMAVRLIELHRVLKPTGSLYLHCDPTASHYLKLLLDGVFGADKYRNEIVWRRTTSHNSSNRYGKIADTILFYTKSDSWTWNDVRTAYSEAQLGRYQEDQNGKLFRAENLTADRRNSNSGKFEWRGTTPPSTRGWAYSIEQLEQWWSEGRILKKRDGSPRMDGLKIYLEGLEGQKLQSVWTDIPRIGNTSAERLGYPTQKPVALLERIVAVSSNEGDVVLDPFCGCGTAIHAAEKLGRRWIGIDVTHLAISLIEKRMRDAFPEVQLAVEGTPKDLASAEDLAARDKYQFQWWAVSMVDAMPFGGKKKGADGGIDGIIYFKPDGRRTEKALVSIKGGQNVGVQMIRELHSAMEREKAPLGVFVTKTSPSSVMEKEAAAVGRFHSEATGKSYPRLQILTLAELFQGKRPDIPYVDPTAAFKQAARESTARQPILL
ncbi:site-specific DNA-methyltransferase [Sphingomonas montanisoli]|uniref:site-specific DNA-methyltransferase (adenine-specific) n=1 Tax=Sphingomonas montanisoli TaxID=2606412 RepID=A0A5D9C4Q7_9SPHN|nr:site-specific DNA-methyltransferase [Sphingomonas montanisoli]